MRPLRPQRLFRKIVIGCFCLLVFAGLAVTFLLRGSLPMLQGAVSLPGLAGQVTVERDENGVATIRGSDRLDVARADMKQEPLPGDDHMPRVHSPTNGASERFVVSPGHEDQGYFHMPTGQSSHPLSPYFGAGHSAWVRGEKTPFLPGATRYTLTLQR